MLLFCGITVIINITVGKAFLQRSFCGAVCFLVLI